nr:MAG TPA: Minor capsid protein from bacteriophage [Caudoviricetes sp.]
MIEKIRDYISKCPYLDEFTKVNVNYLVDKANAYSVNESAGYNPVIQERIYGNDEMQFLFSFDAKFYWNEEIENNIDNSKFFENFKNWLDYNDSNGIYPEIENIEPLTIGAITNGFIYATNSDEAIYRISCIFKYEKEGKI